MTENELLKSIKSYKNNKTPGTDGLTAEFYKFFWQDIKHVLLASINYALAYGKLSVEQRRGIISLLPKKDKDRLYLKNWRPFTLLNVDYKILAKALKNRINSFLPSLIDEDQTGYVKNRLIGSNIRIIEDILMYTQLSKVPGILLAIDFEKAFDSLDGIFLINAYKSLISGKIPDHILIYFTTKFLQPFLTICIYPVGLLRKDASDKAVRYHHIYSYLR